MGVSDLSKGTTIEYQGELYTVVDYSHVFKGRGRAVAQTKLKHLLTGKVISETLSDADDFRLAFLEERLLKYLYSDGERHHFMDNETYEQFSLSREQLAEHVGYLKENMDVTGLFHEDAFLKIRLPITVELRVTESEPGVRGDTVSGAMKPATLETGLTVKVPLFIERGDVIRVDTRDGSYIERVASA